MREKLVSFADQTVAPVAQQKALDATYKKAEPLVRKIVEAKYKPADMAICAKYSVTTPDTCVRIQLSDGAVKEFTFSPPETAPIVVKGSCYSRMYQADEKTSAAIDAWLTAKDAFRDEKRKRIEAYRALTLGSTSVEDVLAVWPEVACLLPADNALIALGPDQMAIIEADKKERKAA
jgi:hypothetical protein